MLEHMAIGLRVRVHLAGLRVNALNAHYYTLGFRITFATHNTVIQDNATVSVIVFPPS